MRIYRPQIAEPGDVGRLNDRYVCGMVPAAVPLPGGITAGLSPRGLRKLAAGRCVEAGASERGLMAIFAGRHRSKPTATSGSTAGQLAEARGARHLLGPGKAPSAEAEITLFAANLK